jgi:hypothetical protein
LLRIYIVFKRMAMVYLVHGFMITPFVLCKSLNGLGIVF